MSSVFQVVVLLCLVAMAMTAPKTKGNGNDDNKKPGQRRATDGNIDTKGLKIPKDNSGKRQFPKHVEFDLTIENNVEHIEAEEVVPHQGKIEVQSISAQGSQETKIFDERNCDSYEQKGKGTYIVCANDDKDDGHLTVMAHTKNIGKDCIHLGDYAVYCKEITNSASDQIDRDTIDYLVPNIDKARANREIPSVGDYDRNLILENLVFVDEAFVGFFRSMAATEDEAIYWMVQYVDLLYIEVNLMFRSILDVSRADSAIEEFELYVLVPTVKYPAIGYELPFVHVRDNGGMSAYCPVGAPSDCVDTLDQFGEYLETKYNNDDIENFDVATLLSGRDIYSTSRGLLGVAWGGVVCISNYWIEYKTNIVEAMIGGEYDIATTLAHEIGHSLGAPHDGNNNVCSVDQYLMAQYYIEADQSNKDTYVSFSSCSVEEIADHLASYGNCLSGTSISDDWEATFCKLNGNGLGAFGLDYQCQLETNYVDSVACQKNSGFLIDGKIPKDACWLANQVWCTNVLGTCSSTIAMVGSGTPCYDSPSTAANDDMICHNRECKLNNDEVCPTTTTTAPATTTTTPTTTTTTPTTTTTAPTTTTTTPTTTTTTPTTTTTTPTTTTTTPTTTTTTPTTTTTTPTTTTTTPTTTTTTPTTTTTTPTTTTTTPTTTTTTMPPTTTPQCNCDSLNCCLDDPPPEGCCEDCELNGWWWVVSCIKL